MSEDLMTYACRVWDSVSGEWQDCLIEIPNNNFEFPRHSEREAELAEAINEAVSIAFDEDPATWFVFGTVTMLGGVVPDTEEVVVVHLLNGKNDLSAIVAVRQH